MRIGILTGGGDVPSLNTVIHDITYRASREKNMEVIGIRRGWGGLIYMNPDNLDLDPNHAIILSEDIVRKIDREGGTFLHTSRTLPSKVKAHKDLERFRGIKLKQKEERDMTGDVLKNLENHKIDYLIVVGGDDTLTYARYLSELGFPLIGVPKTMDGDVAGTDHCLGFSTAINRANEILTDLRTTLGSHERIGVVEIFGRYSGLTALYTALAAKPDRVIIPEVEFEMDRLVELLIQDKERNPSEYSLVLVSEGAKPKGGKMQIDKRKEDDMYGHRKLGGIGRYIARELKKITGENAMEENLRYSLRSGRPSAKDKIVASAYANLAINAILRNKKGKLTSIRNGKLVLVSLEETAKSPVKVDAARLYNVDRFRPNYDKLEEITLVL